MEMVITWSIKHPALVLLLILLAGACAIVLIRILRAIIIGAAIWILVHWFFHDWR